jgi:hypothetical protein
MLALAGRIADGVILNLMSPRRPGRPPRSSGPPSRLFGETAGTDLRVARN